MTELTFDALEPLPLDAYLASVKCASAERLLPCPTCPRDCHELIAGHLFPCIGGGADREVLVAAEAILPNGRSPVYVLVAGRVRLAAVLLGQGEWAICADTEMPPDPRLGLILRPFEGAQLSTPLRAALGVPPRRWFSPEGIADDFGVYTLGTMLAEAR